MSTERRKEIEPKEITTEDIEIDLIGHLSEQAAKTNMTENTARQGETPDASVARITFNLSGIEEIKGDAFREEIGSLRTPEHDHNRLHFKDVVIDALTQKRDVYLTRFRNKVDLFIGQHPDTVRNTAIALGGLLFAGGVVYRLTRKTDEKDQS